MMPKRCHHRSPPQQPKRWQVSRSAFQPVQPAVGSCRQYASCAISACCSRRNSMNRGKRRMPSSFDQGGCSKCHVNRSQAVHLQSWRESKSDAQRSATSQTSGWPHSQIGCSMSGLYPREAAPTHAAQVRRSAAAALLIELPEDLMISGTVSVMTRRLAASRASPSSPRRRLSRTCQGLPSVSRAGITKELEWRPPVSLNLPKRLPNAAFARSVDGGNGLLMRWS